MIGLYKFHWDCGRMGTLDGLFFAKPIDVEKAIGEIIYFGEALGKHSDIYGSLETDEIELVSEDQNLISMLMAALEIDPTEEYCDWTISGHNPVECHLERLSDEEE